MAHFHLVRFVEHGNTGVHEISRGIFEASSVAQLEKIARHHFGPEAEINNSLRKSDNAYSGYSGNFLITVRNAGWMDHYAINPIEKLN